MPRQFCSRCERPHRQFWGSQVCPGGPAHTVSSGGAGCVWEVPLTLSVLGEPGVPRRFCSHHQFWGSRVCPSGPTHTISSGGAGCVRAVPLTLSVLGELGVPGRSCSCCGLSFQACRYGHVQHLEHLLFYGADMGAQNASGNTALHICALYNQVSSRDCAPGPGLCSALCGWVSGSRCCNEALKTGRLKQQTLTSPSPGCTSQTAGPPCLVPGEAVLLAWVSLAPFGCVLPCAETETALGCLFCQGC